MVTKPWWPWLWSWTNKKPRKSFSYFLSSLAKKNVMLRLNNVSKNETAMTIVEQSDMDLTTAFEYLHKLAAKIISDKIYSFLKNFKSYVN